MKSFLILLFSITIIIFNQIFLFPQAGSSIGVKAGYGLSRYYFIVATPNKPITQNFVPVYQGGVSFSQINAKNCGIQVELNYVQKAWEETLGESGKYKAVFNNVELPFLSHFRIGRKNFAWIINMGMHVSYAFKSKIDSSGVHSINSIINYQNLDYNAFDYGVDGGFGFEIGKDKGIFQIQVMYSQGMRNIIDRDPTKVYRSLNQNVFLSMIYKIPLFRKQDN
jgi:hypothetical protein